MEEHQGGADLSHRVTATLRLSVHVRGGRLSGQLSRRHDLIIVSQAATEVVWPMHAIRSSPGNCSVMLLCWSTPVAGTLIQKGEWWLEEKKGLWRRRQQYRCIWQRDSRGTCTARVSSWGCRVPGRSPATCQSPRRPLLSISMMMVLEVRRGSGRSHEGRVKATNFCWTFVEPHIMVEHSTTSKLCRRLHRKI